MNNELENALMELQKVADIDSLTKASNLDISDKVSAQTGLCMGLQTRTLKKKLEETRKEITRPHLDFQRAINKLVKGYTEQLEKIEKSLQDKLCGWFEKESIFEDNFSDMTLEIEEGSIFTKTEYDFSIEDINSIPREFLMVNETAIKSAIKSGMKTIPGLKITKKNNVTMRLSNDY